MNFRALIVTLCVLWSLVIAQSAMAQANEPMAHSPRYDDRSVWPAWVEKTAFVKEEWPKARLLVWAHAGKSLRGADMSDPANWLENGKPVTEGPDENTDIIITAGPDGAKTFIGGSKGCEARHMTVEKGVGAFLKSVSVHGNMWVKDGASWHAISVRGSRDTFMRNDNPTPNAAANKIAFNKPPDKSTEWMGNWKIGDELDLFSGIFVVSPDSTFMPGDRSTQHIYPNAKLVLTSGSAFYKRDNQYWGHDIEIVGEVLAGTPQRPLTKDATLGLSFKAKGAAKGHAKGKESISHLTKEGDMGLILYKEGRLVVHSADPKTARLVIQWRGFGEKIPSKENEPAAVAAMPHGIDMLLLGDASLDGIEFNNVLKGGIAMPDLAARDAWKNVTYGKDNLAPTPELFTKYTGNLDIEMKDTGVAVGLAKKAKAEKEEKKANDE